MATAKTTQLAAQTRTVSGSTASRRLRKDGTIPGVINTEKGGSLLVQLNRHDFEMLLHAHTSESLILDLSVDGGAPLKVLIKEVQRHPVTNSTVHADFREISMTKKMRVPVPVRLVGDPVGVTQEGGVLDHMVRSIEVECLPADLVEEIVVDVSALKMGQSIQVGAIKVDPKLTVITGPTVAIAAVMAPVAEEEVKPEEAEAAPTEPEVIAKGKEAKEGEEGEEGEEGGKEKKGAPAGKEKGEAKKPEGKEAPDAKAGKAPAGKEKKEGKGK